MMTNNPIRVMVLSCLTVLAASSIVYASKPDPIDKDKLVWHDCKDLGVEGKGWTDTLSYYDRLPGKAEGKAPKAVWGLGHDSAGLCVRFTTDASSIQVRWTLLNASLDMPHMPATGVSGVDLYVKDKGGRWRFVANGRPKGVSNTSAFAEVPSGEHYLLYLPLYNGVKSVEIGIPKGCIAYGLQARFVQAHCVLRHLDHPGRLRVAAWHGVYGDRRPAIERPGNQPRLQRQWKDGTGNGRLARRT